MKIRKGDTVVVTGGKDRGKTGKVMQAFPQDNLVVVEGVNKTIKHAKTRKQGEKGQKIEYFGPISVAKVAFIDPKTSKPTRLGYQVLEDGSKVRVAKKSGTTLQ